MFCYLLKQYDLIHVLVLFLLKFKCVNYTLNWRSPDWRFEYRPTANLC